MRVPVQPTLADGLAVAEVGALAFSTAAPRVDRTVTVSEESLALAMLRLVELEKSVVEGAGAAPLAACLSGQLPELAGKQVVLILSGGNVDPSVLARVIDKGRVADGRLCRFTAVVSDRPGGLARLAQLIADAGGSIQEIVHDRAFSGADLAAANVLCTVETEDREHIERLYRKLSEAGMRVLPERPTCPRKLPHARNARKLRPRNPAANGRARPRHPGTRQFGARLVAHSAECAIRPWRLGAEEGADLFIVELAALLHDIADWKFHDGDDSLGPRRAAEWLAGAGSRCGLRSSTSAEIVAHVSFKGAGVPTPDAHCRRARGAGCRPARRPGRASALPGRLPTGATPAGRCTIPSGRRKLTGRSPPTSDRTGRRSTTSMKSCCC